MAKINLPKAVVVTDKFSRTHTECSACSNTPAACLCAGNGITRRELNAIALAIVFGYDLSHYAPQAVEDVREILGELGFADVIR